MRETRWRVQRETEERRESGSSAEFMIFGVGGSR